MRKKIISIVLAIMTLLVITPSFAATDAVVVTGSCKNNFNTTGTLSNGGSGWDAFSFCTTTEISYTNTGSYSAPTENGHVYGYAQPIGTDGTVYGTREKIYLGIMALPTVNSSGASASNAKFKVFNGLKINKGYSSSTMYVEGVMTGTY